MTAAAHPWTPVTFPDGRSVWAGPLSAPHDEAPDVAIYLLTRRPPATAWPHLWVRWPDFGLPLSTRAAVLALRLAHRRAAGQRVEIACRGGVGRTGTALAVLAMFAGVPVDDAVAWVRLHYHPRAVETPWQRAWLHRVGRATIGP